MSNAEVNEQAFAQERQQLIAAIVIAIDDMGNTLRKSDVLAVIKKTAAEFERETYG